MLLQTQSILLVDNDAAETTVILEVLRNQRIANTVQIAGDGAEARSYLLGAGKYADRISYPLPCLVLLDLVVPGGFELLDWIRAHDRFRRLPVVVLTKSADPDRVSRVYAAGANSYLVKPFNIEALRELIKAVNAYWVILVEKPSFG